MSAYGMVENYQCTEVPERPADSGRRGGLGPLAAGCAKRGAAS